MDAFNLYASGGKEGYMSLMIISMTELQFIIFFMKRLNFATDWRCLDETRNLLQNNVAL